MTRSRRAGAVLLVATAVIACSGSDTQRSAGTCSRAQLTGGPGDPAGYFPIDVGRTWSYRVQETGETLSITVSGTQNVGSDVASVFSEMSSVTGAQTELVAKRASGAYVLSDPSVEPPLDQIYPSLLLPFPVAVTAPFEIARCSWIEVGDLDRDGKTDHVDLVASLTIISVSETWQAPGSTQFTDVAHAQMTMHMTVTGTSAGAVSVDATEDSWYVKGIGRVLIVRVMTAGGQTERATASLQTWTVPSTTTTALVAPAVQAEALRSGSPALTSSFEDSARSLAARLLGTLR